jgi:transposase-like protein
VTERPDLTAQGYRRYRCRDCDQQFNERSGGVLNRASLPSDIIAFVVFCRLHYRLTSTGPAPCVRQSGKGLSAR